MKLIDLLITAEEEGIEILESNNIGRLKGLYVDNTITLNTSLETDSDRKGTLAEELGHHYTTYGDIRDQTKVENRKQEKKARAWGYEKVIGIIDIVNAYNYGVTNRFELSEYLNLTEKYINDALTHYKSKYGLYYTIDNYIVYFDPLVVVKKF